MKITNENFFELNGDKPDDEVNENKSSAKLTATERLRNKVMSLHKQDDGETDLNAPALEVPVDNHEDTTKGKTNVPDDKVVDLQKAVPIVFPHDDDDGKPIDMVPSKDDVHQTSADDMAARYITLPEELKEDYQDKDALPKLPTTNDGDEPEANDDEPNANGDEPKANGDEPNANDDEPNANDDEPNANGDEPNANGDEADERIQLKQPDDKHPKKVWSRKKILAIVGGVAFALIAAVTIAGISRMHSTASQSRTESSRTESSRTESSRTVTKAKKTATSSSSSSADKVDGGSLNAVKEKLTAAAKATTQPHKVQVTALGGGYTMGVITYYPNDATKTYMDYSVTAPKTPGAVTDDKKAQDINKKLSSSLPTINKTITVIDKSKVSMATYKQSDGSYHTILIYDKQPFGFVTTKTDGSMVNNVTTYYIQKVQKNN